MHIFVVRHGETEWNAAMKVCGSTDLPLTEQGLEQARVMAEKAAQCGIERIIASPLIRARQTAEAAAKVCGLPVETDPRLKELDYGQLEGIGVNDPDFRNRRSQFPYRFPDGESYLQMIHRVYSFLDEVKERYGDEKILIVCHAGVCRVIRTYFESMTNDEYYAFRQDNAAIREYKL